MTVSRCIRQGSKRNDDSVSVEELDWSAESPAEHLWCDFKCRPWAKNSSPKDPTLVPCTSLPQRQYFHPPSLICNLDLSELTFSQSQHSNLSLLSSFIHALLWVLAVWCKMHPRKKQRITSYFFPQTHTVSMRPVHISDLYTHNCLYYTLCFCYFVHCLFV